MRTEKQKAQWERRFLLGTLVGLSCWITSKQFLIRDAKILSFHTRMGLVTTMDNLAYQLRAAAYEMGWKGPKT